MLEIILIILAALMFILLVTLILVTYYINKKDINKALQRIHSSKRFIKMNKEKIKNETEILSAAWQITQSKEFKMARYVESMSQSARIISDKFLPLVEACESLREEILRDPENYGNDITNYYLSIFDDYMINILDKVK